MVSPALPSELLYKIVLFTATNYIDDLVAGPLSIPHTGLDVPHTAAELEALRLDIDKSDPALCAPSPLRPLLCASYQLRSIALKVLSHVLGIRVVPGPANLPRLAADPWATRIQPTRLAYANPQLTTLSPFYKRTLDAATASPLLRIYQVVGCAETVLTAPETYGVETMRRARETLLHVREEIVSLRYELDTWTGREHEDWLSSAGERVQKCDERSYSISVFTIGLTLLRTNLCAIHRALQMLRTDSESSTSSDPFFLSMAHIYQDNVATLLADVQDFARIQATVFVPKSQKRPFLPPHISADDIQSACNLFKVIISTPPHPAYGSRWTECQDAARAVRAGLETHLAAHSS